MRAFSNELYSQSISHEIPLEYLSKLHWTYLDDTAASRLQVSNLLTQGEGNLEGLRLASDVLAGEGPVEDGYRACEHALDWPLGQVLGVLELLHSHG